MSNRKKKVILLTITKMANKRLSLFFKCFVSDGYIVKWVASPFGAWDFSSFESQPPEVKGRMTASQKKEQYDTDKHASIVVCFHWLMLYPACLYKLFFKCTLIYDEHDDYELNNKEHSSLKGIIIPVLIKATNIMLLRFCDGITCINMQNSVLKKKLSKWNNNVVELNNYPDETWYETENTRRDSNLKIVYIGGIWHEKGCEIVANATRSLRSQGLDCEAHYFGSGDTYLIEKLVGEGIHFHGRCSSFEIASFLFSNHAIGTAIYQNTNRYALIGNNSRKVFEYMATGTPVIASDVGSLPDILSNGRGYILSKESPEEDFALFVKNMLHNMSIWESMSCKSRNYVREENRIWSAEWSKVKNMIDGLN